MRKLLCLLLALLLIVPFAACGNTTPDAPPPEGSDVVGDTTPGAEIPPNDDGYPIALITDLGTIDDKSFNQGSWEGVVQYANEFNVAHKYYQPTEQSDDAYLTAIDLAITGGAKVIVTPGFLFGTPIYKAQDMYPEVCFILLDAVPNNGDFDNYDVKISANAVGIGYAEDQAGFLAGYAAVKDGNRKLGFVGGMAVPAVVRFGYGFIQGAEYAAKELELAKGDIEIKYNYTGKFDATPEAQALAASWFQGGTEVIFGCGGAVGNSVMAAAQDADKKVIGVDVDQSGESPTVITSAMKGLKASVYDTLKDFFAESFPGAKELTFDASNQGIGLPMETSKFETFTQADYDAIYALLASGEIGRMMDKEGTVSPDVVPVEICTVTEVK